MVATDVAFTVTDLRRLAREMRQFSDEAVTSLKDANLRAAQRIVKEALPNVPVRTGRLKASVRASAGAQSAKMRAGGARVPYAPAVHWGTGPRTGRRGPHNIDRNPFLWNAREKLGREVRDQYERELDAVVKQFRFEQRRDR